LIATTFLCKKYDIGSFPISYGTDKAGKEICGLCGCKLAVLSTMMLKQHETHNDKLDLGIDP
jgi:hypothetical protein